MIAPGFDSRPTLHWWALSDGESALNRGRHEKSSHVEDSLHMLRDGVAALNVKSVLDLQYRFGGTLLNLPWTLYGLAPPTHPPLLSCTSGADDLVLMTTRPPAERRYDLRAASHTTDGLGDRENRSAAASTPSSRTATAGYVFLTPEANDHVKRVAAEWETRQGAEGMPAGRERGRRPQLQRGHVRKDQRLSRDAVGVTT